MTSAASIHGQTGPRTPEGKAKSSQNAVSHGGSSRVVVLPHEDAAAFDQLLSDLTHDLGPNGAHELFLVRQMAESQWRLNRLRKIETALVDQLLLGAEPGPEAEDQMAKAMIDRGGDPLNKIERYAANAERSYYRARRELTTYRKIQNEMDPPARELADFENFLHQVIENEERFLSAANPCTKPEPPQDDTGAVEPDSRPLLPMVDGHGTLDETHKRSLEHISAKPEDSQQENDPMAHNSDPPLR